MNLVVDAVTKESKQFGNTVIWGIKTKDGNWYDFHGGFKPSKGQSLNCKIWTVNSKNGKDYMHADLIPEHPQQAQQAQPRPPASIAEKIDRDAAANGTGIASYADFKKAEAAAGNAPRPKIKWSEWCEMAEAVSQLAHRLEPDRLASTDTDGISAAYSRMKFVNTTLMEYAKGNLELPTEAGPVSGILSSRGGISNVEYVQHLSCLSKEL